MKNTKRIAWACALVAGLGYAVASPVQSQPQAQGSAAPVPDEDGTDAVYPEMVLSRGPVPPRPVAPGFGDALPPLRDFFLKAEAADAIADPLARCLAFPDLPGSVLPAGLAEAHCKFLHGSHIMLADIDGLVRQKRFHELDALYRADLDRHFSTQLFSEVIHRDFSDFDASVRAGLVSAAWLKGAPMSPYALTARAAHLRRKAWEARGFNWASETPDENIRRMHLFAGQAADLYQRAIKLEPRLMPAYSALIDIGNLDSRPELEENALAAAMRVDPACHAVALASLMARSPRWGGSHEAMRQFAAKLAPYRDTRPLLALDLAAPASAIGNELVEDRKYEDAVRELAPIALTTTDASAMTDLAFALLNLQNLRLREGSNWYALAYLIESDRFDEERLNPNLYRGVLLIELAHRNAWAETFLKRAIALDPHDGSTHSTIANAYEAAGDRVRAEAEYRSAMLDPKNRKDATDTLIWLLFKQKDWQRGLVEAEVLNRDYPDYGKGWLLRFYALRALHQAGQEESLQRFLATADTADPETPYLVAYYEKQLRKLQAGSSTNR